MEKIRPHHPMTCPAETNSTRIIPRTILPLIVTLLLLLLISTCHTASPSTAETCYSLRDKLITARLQPHRCHYMKQLEVILVQDYKRFWMGSTDTKRECLWKCVRNRTDCEALSAYRNGNDVTWMCYMLKATPTKDDVFKVDFLHDDFENCTFYTVKYWGCTNILPLTPSFDTPNIPLPGLETLDSPENRDLPRL